MTKDASPRKSKFGELTPDENHVVLKSQGDVLRLQSGGPKRKVSTRGDRKPCAGQSDKSCNAMQEKVKRVNYASQKHVSFITLTYPPECWAGWEAAELHRRAFIERLRRWCKRHGVLMCSGFWKKEPHTKRPDVLHFHLLLFGLPYLPHAELVAMWSEVIGSVMRPARCEIKDVGGSAAVAMYVAKYVSKALSYLVSSTNLHGGRWWGAINREAIPWAALEEIRIPRGDWMLRMKRVARKVRNAELSARLGKKVRRSRGYSNNNPGFRLFVRDVDKWWRLVTEFVRQDWNNPRAWYVNGGRGVAGKERPL